jgi:hypothetical protein
MVTSQPIFHLSSKIATQQTNSINQISKKLYRRIHAVGCHTTIYLASLKARNALTLEVINRLRSPDRQVVIIVVENRAIAQYWAGELRQMGKFSSSEVQIFGVDRVERLDQAIVVIYRHDQIARRLPQHVSRLEQAEKRITAVVDGCDLLDPVELAILLYECDQFIGLNHLTWGYRNTRGHRMLNVVLHNRSLIDYSFADAEREGWGYTIVGMQRRVNNRYYHCNGAWRKPKVCSMPHFRVDLVNSVVWQWIKETLEDPENSIDGLRGMKENSIQANQALYTRLKIIEEQLNEVEQQKSRLLDLYLGGDFPKEMLQ